MTDTGQAADYGLQGLTTMIERFHRDQRDQAWLLVSCEETSKATTGTPGDNIPTCHIMGRHSGGEFAWQECPTMHTDTGYQEDHSYQDDTDVCSERYGISHSGITGKTYCSSSYCRAAPACVLCELWQSHRDMRTSGETIVTNPNEATIDMVWIQGLTQDICM